MISRLPHPTRPYSLNGLLLDGCCCCCTVSPPPLSPGVTAPSSCHAHSVGPYSRRAGRSCEKAMARERPITDPPSLACITPTRVVTVSTLLQNLLDGLPPPPPAAAAASTTHLQVGISWRRRLVKERHGHLNTPPHSTTGDQQCHALIELHTIAPGPIDPSHTATSPPVMI